MNDIHFKKLLDEFQLSWSGYFMVRKGSKKRICRHMQLLDCRSIDEYLKAVKLDAEARSECRRLLTVSISRLFRDRELWRVLERNILPELISRGLPTIRVWSAGCARGEEIYSFKIIWRTFQERFKFMPQLEAWATDMNPEYLDAALNAEYSASSLREFPEHLKGKYLKPGSQKSFYTIPDFIKHGIFWRAMDLVQDDPPANHFHIIFLRNNVLTYCQEALQLHILQKVLSSLGLGGYLLIGAKEKLPLSTDQLSQCYDHPNVFCKND